MSTLHVFNPYTLEKIDSIPLQGPEALEEMLSRAYALSLDTSRALPAHARIRLLEKLAAAMEDRVEELTRIAAEEGGKPYTDSRVEVLRAINGVKTAATEIHQLKGEQIPMGLTEASAGRMAFTFREPIGVVAAISAFNHPLNLIVHQAVTAFAAGCPVIVKPANTTPRSCITLVGMMHEVGIPEDWVQVLISDNETAERLATDERVNFLTFIGSAKVGWYLKSKVAPGTRVALEHGGAAPVLVEEDADRAAIVGPLAKGGFYHAGQVCVSVQRVFVHASQAEAFAEQLAAAGEALTVGDPLDKATDVGPLILPDEVERVAQWVEEAISEGARCLTGGKKIGRTCYAPTVLYNPSPESKVSTEEIFGPVICVYPYTDRAEAIRQANALPYHFQASVFTQNVDKAFSAVRQLNALAVMVNDHTAFRVDWMPFGGRDASGEGIGGIAYSMHEMTRPKLMVIKSPAFE